MLRFLRSLNSHSIAHFGALLVSLGGVVDIPVVNTALSILLKPDNAKHVQQAGVIAVGLGSALLYFGRPDTIPADPQPAQPAPPAKGSP